MSLFESVREFVVSQLADDESRLTVVSIADAFMRSRVDAGEWVENVPDDQRVAQYIGLSQVVREKLRLIVPANPEPDIEPDQLALIPEHKLLNWRYSVKGEGGEEYYVPRAKLTEDEMRQITHRFRATASHLNRHAKALEADWYRSHAA